MLKVAYDPACTTDYEAAEIRAAFSEFGIPIDLQGSLGRKSQVETWQVLLLFPVSAFITGLAAEAGKDAWKAMKGLVKRVYEAHGQGGSGGARRGSILLWDKEQHTRILLSNDLPDEAWRQLPTLRRGCPASGTIAWDHQAQEWRDVRDIGRG